MTVSLSAAALSVLEEGRQAYVCVRSKDGPHVTPELYAWSGGRLWFASASTTLKTKVLAARPEVGLLVSVPGRSVVVTGEVQRYDPRSPYALVCHALELPAAARAMARFTTRNAPDLLAFVSDTARGRLGSRIPPVRVLFAVRPERAVVLDRDEVVTEAWGWGDAALAGDGDEAAVEPVPADAERAVAGLPGPVALPGRWAVGESQFHVAPGLVGLLPDEREFPISVVTDDYAAPGPAAKSGALARGWASRESPESPVVLVDTHRVVKWDGVETRSVS